MKALVYEGPEKLRVAEFPKPVPKPGEVLVKIKACGICGSDIHGYLGITGRRVAPMVMGHEFSGVIELLGENCSGKFHAGDRVTVQPVNFCGTCENCRKGFTNVCQNKKFFGVMDVDGAFEEYLCVPEKLLYRLPDSMSYLDGAMTEPMAVAYCGVSKAGDLKGKTVLIVGGGTIGQLALLAAKAKGAGTLLLSDISKNRRETARKLGADFTIDASAADFQGKVREALDGNLVDVAIEAVGISATVKQAVESLKPQGACVWIGNSAKEIQLNMQSVVTQEFKLFGTYIYTHEEFGKTIGFMQDNSLDFSEIITGQIPLEEAPGMFRELVAGSEQHLKVVVTF